MEAVYDILIVSQFDSQHHRFRRSLPDIEKSILSKKQENAVLQDFYVNSLGSIDSYTCVRHVQIWPFTQLVRYQKSSRSNDIVLSPIYDLIHCFNFIHRASYLAAWK